MALVDGTVSHCCSHQQPQARVMCISHEHMRLLVLLTRSDAELPLENCVHVKGIEDVVLCEGCGGLSAMQC